MVMRTFVQCMDRHGREDKTHIFMYYCAFLLLIIYLCSVWTDIVMRTGHLFVQCVDRHGHKDRTLVHMHPEIIVSHQISPL